MKAVVCEQPLPIGDPRSLVDREVPDPGAPTGHDLLVRVHAVSVNPVDTKMRVQAYAGGPKSAEPRILGFDAAGVVEKAGEHATLFKAGDAVYYAGSNVRPGSNAELQLVDERIVGAKPATLSFPQAAALPLTTITAYEAIVDRLGAASPRDNAGRSLLVIAGAGGVGSMAIQIGRQLGLRVVATASRAESAAWCRALGAAEIVDPRKLLAEGMREVEYILNCADIDAYWERMADVIAPQGAICSIVSSTAPLDLMLLRRKCASFAWEAMFTRPLFGTPDMIEQHRLLGRVGAWIDAGEMKTTLTEQLGPINAQTMRAAHARVESKTMIGKLVVSGW
jgi:zinc-binding alcohol dehydrogenase family protein